MQTSLQNMTTLNPLFHLNAHSAEEEVCTAINMQWHNQYLVSRVFRLSLVTESFVLLSLP